MSNQNILIIEDNQGRREIQLAHSTYLIGRDAHCDIRIFSKLVSPHHAILVRQNREDGGYDYKIIDGDPFGRPSENGLLVNGQKTCNYHLQNQDEIIFVPHVKAMYYTSNPPTPVKPSTSRLGGLYVQSSNEQQLSFPLNHTEVSAKIAGNVSRVEVTQTFENPFATPLEAIYIFPLPDEAAVDEMEIKIGERIIKGSIKKREEAQKIYEQAKQEGRTAGLLEQERENIFTQSLANIKPGERIDVTLRYTDSLRFQGGDYEFVFPMVVGPRFIPGTPIEGSHDTDQVPDASRITTTHLPPADRSGHDIAVTIEIDAGMTVRDVRSPSHQLRIEHDKSVVRVKLGNEDTIPNKDLILRYRVAGEQTEATVLTQLDERGGHFAIYLIPAIEYRTDEIVPKDVVFLMDTSGSQQGDPLRKSQELMRRFINELNPNDTFSIIDFANTTQQLSSVPLANTPQNRALAMSYINKLQANGGTALLNGIQAVMNFPSSPDGRLRSIVLVTDGYIGNDHQVLAEVQKRLQPGNRLYSFGVGSSVNRFLLSRLAEIGRGTCQIVRQDEPTAEVAEKFFQQINNPVLTNIQLSWKGSGETPVIYPSILPDLFAEQPLVVFGRKQDGTAGKLQIRGVTAGGNRYEKTLDLNFKDNGNPAIAQLWARARIKDLMKEMFAYETKGGVEAACETALTYQLLSPYTAFVAVSDDVRVDRESGVISIQVPIDMPEGVSSQGIFGNALSWGSLALAPQAMVMRSAVPKPGYSAETAPSGKGIFGKAREAVRGIFGQNPSMASLSTSPTSSADEFDLALIDPASMSESKDSPTVTLSKPQLQVVSVTGLNEVAATSLTRHLQQLSLSAGLSGVIVFEFLVGKGRVGRIMLDEEASTLKQSEVIELIKRVLITWSVPHSLTGTVDLTLQIQS